jgi:outer membrane protein OmpA-like peptidoglycan-associated protein
MIQKLTLLAVPVVVDNGGGTCDISPAFQPRKLRKLTVKTYANTENLWMGNTLEGIQIAEKTNKKALGLLEDKKEVLEDMVGFDFNQDVIDLLLEQKDTLTDLKDYILRCGAKETRITKRWERLE